MAVTATQTGLLVNDADGDGIIDPADIINPVPTTGDTVRTTVVITNTSGPDATSVFFVENGDGHLNGMTQVGNINVSPIAFNDAYTAIGNTLLEVGNATAQTGPQKSVAGHVTDNDVEFFGDTFTISAFQASSVNGGTVTMVQSGADMGSFTYVSAANFTGTDTFTYTLRDKGLDGVAGNSDDLTSTATVTITVANQVWYVDAAAGAGGTGTSTNPYNSLASVSGGADVDDTGDIIFVRTGTYSTGVTLENSQTLWGEGTTLVVDGFTLQAAGGDAVIDPGTGTGVTLNIHNTLKGFTVEDTATDIQGTDVGNLTVTNVDLTGTGRLVNLTSSSAGTVNATFDTATTTGTGTAMGGLTLTNLVGSITFNNASISGNDGTEKAIDIFGGTANVDFNGSVTHTANSQAIAVVNKTGGTVSIDGNVSSTGSSDGISLTGNAGATISFTGALTLTTSASNTTAFNATGGGTVTATATGSTISSGSGIGLNVSGTEIGSAGLTFQSISTNGASSGIVLNNTGTAAGNGGLTVTGDATTASNGSGGVIQNSTGVGISLTTTKSVSLDQVNVQTGGNDGINGSSVTGFSLTHSNITSNGNAVGENGIEFTNLLGTAVISDTVVHNSFSDGLRITNTSGTLDSLNIKNDTFDQSTIPVSPAGGNGVVITMQGTSVMTDGSISNSTFRNNFSNGILVNTENTSRIGANDATSSSTDGFVVSGSTFDDNNIAIQFGVFQSSDLTVDIQNNSIINDNRTATSGANSTSTALIAATSSTSTAGATLNARIEGNTIGNAAIDGSGSSTGNGIRVIVQGLADVTALINNNTIREAPVGFGMDIESLGSTSGTPPKSEITITNNNVDHVNTGFKPGTSDFPLPAIYVSGDNQGTAGELDVSVTGNTVPSGTSFNFTGAFLELFEYTGPTGDLRLVDNAPASANATAELTSHNTGSAAASAGVTLIAGPLNLPPDLTPLPLMAATGGVGDPGTAPSSDTTPATPPANPVDTGGQPAGTPAQPAPGIVETHLTQAELDTIVTAAITRWEAAGLTAGQDAYLHNVSVNVADMAGMFLGQAAPGHVTIDSDAAGYGWYVDANPADDAEFANATGVTRLLTDSGAVPAGHIDLLTTVMHELGHQLGLDDSYALADRDGLMYGYLVTGERRLPGDHEANGATPGAIDHEEFLVGPISIGTLPIGQTVTIQWDATVDAQSNQLIQNLSNQGTVTGNQPGAFSVNTDGDTGTAGIQTTSTILDSLALGNLVFWDKNGDGLFNGADVGVNGVTLSLFVDANNDDAPDVGTSIASTTTANVLGVDGTYGFTGIAPGHYIVRVDAGNFAGPAGALKFLQTSPTTTPEPIDPDASPNPPADTDNDDNGARTLGQPAFSNAITLTYNNEPTGFVSGNDTNLTLDFGFTNIAPVLDDTATPVVAAINEDAGAPGVGSGTLVSALVDLTPPVGGGLDNVTDADSTQTGLALTAADNTNGTWKYSLNGGTSWTNVPAVTDDSALLLAPDANTRVYFQPNANFNGTSSITFRAWDQTDGSANGGTADPTPAGGSTAFSAVFDSAEVTVNAVNDAPAFAGLDGTPTFVEDGPAVVLDGNATVSDVELDAANDYGGATLTLVRSTGTNPDDVFSEDNGTLTFGVTDVSLGGTQVGTYTHVNGTLVITFDSGATAADADSVLQQLTYRNTNDNPPGSVTINYQFSDGNAGAQGSGATPGLATGSVLVTITAVNDAPVLDDSATPVVAAINEDAGAPGVGSGTLVSALVDLTPPAGGGLDNVTDVDNAVTGLALTAADNTDGTWKYSTNGGTSWSDVGAVTDDAARVLFADANTRVYFQPNADFNGTSSITFRAWDRSDGSANGFFPVDPSPGGDPTAFSAVFDSASVTVNSVNDAPGFTGTAAGVTFNEDAVTPVAIATSVTASDVDSANYDNGSLHAQITANLHTGDTLSIENGANISVSGSTVSFDADGAGGNPPVDIGTLDAGNTATDILVHLNANADDAAVQALTEAFRYFTASQDPSSDTRTVTFTLVDGGGTANTGQDTTSFTADVAVAASNDKPVVDIDFNDDNTVAGAYKTFYIPAGTAVAVTDTDVSVIDPDDSNMESATITIVNFKPSDQLTVNGALPGGIIALGGGTTTITLSGSTTKANYAAALHQIEFSNGLANPDTTDRDVSVVVSDGTDPSDAVHATIVINNPPTVPSDTDATADAVTEGAPVDTLLGIDADSTDPEAAGAIVYSLTTNPGGFFKIDSGTGVVSVSTAGATGIDFEGSGGSYGITVKATDTAGAFSTQSFTIAVNDVAPTAPVDTVAPTGGTVQEGAPNTTTVGITAASTDVNGGTPTYAITAGNADGAFAIDSSTGVVTVADATKLDFETATSRLITVQASAGSLTNTQDFTIAVTDAPPSVPVDTDGAAGGSVSEGAANGATVGITAASSDVNSGTVSFSLFDDAGGRFAIDSGTGVVTVANAALLNFEGATSHDITVRASDPSLAFNDATFTIAVTNVAPVATGDAYSVSEDNTLTVAATGVLGNDGDVHGGAITAVLDTGPANAASFALQSDGSFSYTPGADFHGSDSFTYHPFDGTVAGNTVTVDLTVDAVADIQADAVTVAEDSGTTVLNLLGNDTFSNPGRAITGVTAAAHGTAAINDNGTVGLLSDDYVTYTPDANYFGPDGFDYTVTSNGTTEQAAVSVTVTSVNDAPALANVDANAAYTENGAPVPLDTAPLIVPSDIDNATLSSATIAITSGFVAGDILDWPNFPVPASLGASYNPATGVLTINAVDTLADYQQVLRGITFSSTSDDPGPSRTITWTITDNGTPNLSSAPVTTTVAVTEVNDAPVNTVPGPQIALGHFTRAIAGLAVADLDLGANNITVTLHVDHGTLHVRDDVVGGLDATDITGNGSATVTLQCDIGFVNATLAAANGVAYTATGNYIGPDTLTMTSDDGGHSGLGGVLQDIDTVAITVKPPGGNQDFDGDGKGDALLQAVDGTTYAWLLDGLHVAAHAPLPPVDPSWHLLHNKQDFDGDGKTDVLLQNDSGAIFLWEMNGLSVKAFGALPSVAPSWHVRVTGDFDGDGKGDLLLQNDTGQTFIWEMNGFNVKAFAPGPTTDPHWHFAASGDLDGDGKTDLILQNDTGQTFFWEMDGLNVKAFKAGPTVDPHWHIKEAGDFNGDGNSDIVLQHDDGQTFFWQMNGLDVTAFAAGPTVNSHWHIVGTPDLDGDGKNDIELHNDNGTNYFWEMDGFNVKAHDNFFPIHPDWHVV